MRLMGSILDRKKMPLYLKFGFWDLGPELKWNGNSPTHLFGNST